jgi:prepilin-type N-terminal cleavage/methylation domain-containing protein
MILKGYCMTKIYSTNRGFTLIELLVAMGLAAIVGVAVLNLFTSQNRTFDVQEQTVSLHQNLRASMSVLERDLRWAGYDPGETGNFFVTNIQCRNVATNTNANCDIGATTDITVINRVEPAITFTAADNDFDGNDETFDYSIFDSMNDNILDLARSAPDTGVGNRRRLAEGVECLGLAYAFSDDSGGIQLNPATGQPFWAFDSDNDNVLDSYLDQDNNGVIDIADDPTGAALPTLVPSDEIVAVKIWLLGRTQQPDPQFQAANVQYKVGNRVVNHPNDNIRRQLITTVVKLRNMEF